MTAKGRGSTGRSGCEVLVAVSPRLLAEFVADRLRRELPVTVSAICCTARELSENAAAGAWDVIVLDPRLVTGSVSAFARSLPRERSEPTLVLLTGRSSEYFVPDAITAGCTSFASTDLDPADLVEAVRAACDGRAHIDRSLLMHSADQLAARPPTTRGPLTDRELDVLVLAADGLSAPATAEQLGLSVNTVRHHLQNVLTKLSAHSRIEAVSTAIRLGLIPPRT